MEDTRRFYLRISAIIAVSTVVLTFSFVGVLAFISGEPEIPLARLPWYLVVGAAAFVASIVMLEEVGGRGRDVIVTAAVNGVFLMIIAALCVEGILFTIRNPEDVFVSQLVLYFLAAGLAGTGIAYWALHHWREYTTPGERL